MDFGLSKELEMMRKAVRKFITKKDSFAFLYYHGGLGEYLQDDYRPR